MFEKNSLWLVNYKAIQVARHSWFVWQFYVVSRNILWTRFKTLHCVSFKLQICHNVRQPCVKLQCFLQSVQSFSCRRNRRFPEVCLSAKLKNYNTSSYFDRIWFMFFRNHIDFILALFRKSQDLRSIVMSYVVNNLDPSSIYLEAWM